ncbi:MAG: transglutaminase-like domain-containing protein [Candidatus Pacearchaeota archaeon]|nr:transglutaminase-like domain-containing protein [Candidatus Pacearchaeota archaeon]
MKKSINLILIVLAMFLLSTCFLSFQKVQAADYYDTIKQQNISLEIINTLYSESSRLGANLSFFPKTDERQLVSLQTDPKGKIYDQSIYFNFERSGDLKMVLLSNITTDFLIKPIPYVDINALFPEIAKSEYTKSTNFTDSNNFKIKNKAQQLAQGSTDSFEILYKLAEYVKNSMAYDLNFNELKKASEIIEEKKGVCAQYTILFNALSRALGFPTRYISGVAYSTASDSFEEHAWSEVWLPEIGWVPFDTTFGQYGWLDTYHIALKKGLDAGESSIVYNYIGGYIQPDQIQTNAEIINQSGLVKLNISLEGELLKEKVSQQSYVPLKVRITNNENYYFALPVRVSIAPEVYGRFQKILLLKPGESIETYFLIYVPYESECRRGCTSNIEVLDIFNDSIQTKITFSDSYDRISLEDAIQLMNSTGSIDLYDLNNDIDFYCRPEKEVYTKDEERRAICNVKTQKEETLKICYESQCIEKYFNKDENVELEPINISSSETSVCLTIIDSNLSLNSCLDFAIKKERNIFGRIADFFVSLYNRIF